MNQNLLLTYGKTLFACFVLMPGIMFAQNRKARVLFIGNSYTHVNDLPKLVADMAASTGDTLEYDMSAPGSATLNHHYVFNTVTKAKIQAGGWDYVVLQDQSLEPARAPNYFNVWVYPFAKYLVDDVKLYNPCAEVIFYMTWGRKNGYRPFCPQPIGWNHYCWHHTMDSVLRSRYMLMTDSNKVTVSPVAAVWRYIRTNHPGIELYDADESHPSAAGSYAGACSFYTAIFKKSAELVTYNFSLPAQDAATIRTVARKVVYDSLPFWRIGKYETMAAFSHNANGMPAVSFTNKSLNATQYEWDFGDGQTSTQADPSHTYTSPGTYNVRLIATGNLQCKDTAYAKIERDPIDAAFTIAPNPATNKLYVRSGLFAEDIYRIQILNTMGQRVYEQQSTDAETQTVNVLALANGIYTLRIFNANRSLLSKKIIVQH